MGKYEALCSSHSSTESSDKRCRSFCKLFQAVLFCGDFALTVEALRRTLVPVCRSGIGGHRCPLADREVSGSCTCA